MGVSARAERHRRTPPFPRYQRRGEATSGPWQAMTKGPSSDRWTMSIAGPVPVGRAPGIEGSFVVVDAAAAAVRLDGGARRVARQQRIDNRQAYSPSLMRMQRSPRLPCMSTHTTYEA